MHGFFGIPKPQPPQQTHEFLSIGPVDGVGKEILETIQKEHPHTISFEFIPFQRTGVFITAWMIQLGVKKGSKHKLNWVEHCFYMMVTENRRRQQELQKLCLFQEALHPKETPYIGSDPLLNWYPVEPEQVVREDMPARPAPMPTLAKEMQVNPYGRMTLMQHARIEAGLDPFFPF